ncbi:hypothetical protein BJ165DRAFT_1529434 [Panaeolus papilionaceus]|nr:hypothetical protein BJ165DRAFT_1529434 [Panaeolus papilionaceus]
MSLLTKLVSNQQYIITLIAFLFIRQVTSSPLPLPSLTSPQIHDPKTIHQRDQDPPPSGFRHISIPSSSQNRPLPPPPPPQVNYVPIGVKHGKIRAPIPPLRSASFGPDANERTRYVSSGSSRDPLRHQSDVGSTSRSGSKYPSGPPPSHNTVNAARPIPDYEYGEGPVPSGSKRPSGSDSRQAHSSTQHTAQDVPPPPSTNDNRYKGTATHFARPPIGPEEEQKLPGARRLQY